MTAENATLMKITATREQIRKVFGNCNEEDGFSDWPLTVTLNNGMSVVYTLSYDGESELLANIVSRHDSVSDLEAIDALREHFNLLPA